MRGINGVDLVETGKLWRTIENSASISAHTIPVIPRMRKREGLGFVTCADIFLIQQGKMYAILPLLENEKFFELKNKE